MTLLIWHRWFQSDTTSRKVKDVLTFWFIWENTLESFQFSLDRWADSIELDIHQCKSWELIVIHDETVDRTTDGHGSIQNLTLSEIKQLHTRNNQWILTLDQAMNFSFERDCMLNIEIKWVIHKSYLWALTRSLMTFLMKWWDLQKILISSFDVQSLLSIKMIHSWVKTSRLVSHLTNEKLQYCVRKWIFAISPYSLVLYMMWWHFSTMLEEYSVNLIPWWVRNKKQLDFFQSNNVYGVISNVWF